MGKSYLSLLGLIILAQVSYAQVFPEAQKKEMRDKIKSACEYAWDGYRTYAWGADALKPISAKPHNWYEHSLLMTPVDAYDTFVLMGMEDESAEAKKVILSDLTFDLNQDVQVFEVTIRLLGGLISAYELDGEKKFLKLAEDLGKRLLPAFNSPTGMPYRFVNLQTGVTRDKVSNPAEIGTLMLEFGKLSRLTKDTAYYNKAKRAILEVFNRRSKLDLPGSEINVETGEWVNTESHISGGIDSYYEYLYKSWLVFGDEDFKNAWDTQNEAVKKQLFRTELTGSYFAYADMNTGKETHAYSGALDAFYAGLLALSGDIAIATPLQTGNYHMWTQFNMEPEMFDFKEDTIVYGKYPLRPENIESCFYLHYFTGDDTYLWMGKRMIDDILKNCKTPNGYAAIRNVKMLEQYDSMESFFFAETLKYAYLLFAPKETVDLSEVVFNTEAHPLRIQK